MRYFIAYMLEHDAGTYHRDLSDELAERFQLRPVSERVDPHLTLKSPFEIEDVSPVVDALKTFANAETPQPLQLAGIDGFRENRVVYMDVSAPEQTHALVRRLQDQLRQIPELTFWSVEFPVTLHATLCRPKNPERGARVRAYLHAQTIPMFDCMFDHVALLYKPESRWEILERFPLG